MHIFPCDKFVLSFRPVEQIKVREQIVHEAFWYDYLWGDTGFIKYTVHSCVQDGKARCKKRRCPSLKCHLQIRDDGQCCPRCAANRHEELTARSQLTANHRKNQRRLRRLRKANPSNWFFNWDGSTCRHTGPRYLGSNGRSINTSLLHT